MTSSATVQTLADELQVSRRAAGPLVRAGIIRAADLAGRSLDDLRDLRGVGPLNLQAIEDAAARSKVTLAPVVRVPAAMRGTSRPRARTTQPSAMTGDAQ